MLDDEALAKRLAEEACLDEAHQAMKEREDLLDEEAQLQKRLQEIQLKKQMSHAYKAITEQTEQQQAEKALQEPPDQAPLQSSTGNISPEVVCSHCRVPHEGAKGPNCVGEVQEGLPISAAAPAVAGTPTPPDDEDTPSVGGAPTETHIQADAPAASLTSLAVEAHGTDANDWSSSVSQPTGEADADDIASIAMSEYVVPTVP